MTDDLFLTPSALTLESATFLTQACEQIRQQLRPGQQAMADWSGGQLAVSAVPGAGKSTGMAAAAALTIARHQLHSQRQLIVVTFTRSAAANLKAKIRDQLKGLNLPQVGFAVHTLHGLALNIALRYPELSGLNLENSILITRRHTHSLIQKCVEHWISNHPHQYQILVQGNREDGEETEQLRRKFVLRTEILPQLATTAIHEAKSSGFFPEDLWAISEQMPDEYSILKVAAGLYETYQTLLHSQNLIDYDEMILGAKRVLADENARKLEQGQVFAVFEDEAQDSTCLQSELLEILATDTEDPSQVNLIRVGDPNQAINSTFTPADPIYFRRFCQEREQAEQLATMNLSGRSSLIILEAANFMLEWVNQHYTGLISPFRSQKIQPVPGDDPQANANPAPAGLGLEIYTPQNPRQTVEWIGKRVIELMGNLISDSESPPPSVSNAAILVRENKQGHYIAEILQNPEPYGLDFNLEKDYGIRVYEVADQQKRSQVPGELLTLLKFIDRPHSSDFLKSTLKILADRNLIPRQDFNQLASEPEKFLYPTPLEPPQAKSVRQCRYFCCSLLQARLGLPLYQLIPFLALCLKYDATELATADQLSERIALQTQGSYTMGSMLTILGEIVSTERFEPIDLEQSEERYTQTGQLTIITMHKAKGLDWDYVFLPFLQADLIPGKLKVMAQGSFLGDFTLAEVARAQIRAQLHGEMELPPLKAAWEQAKQLKTAEEFRLLYVAMTRAKRLLWMSAELQGPFSWNQPENLQKQDPCPVVTALQRQFADHCF